MEMTSAIDLGDGNIISPSDVFIAVMGMTGSGKSTFISKCIGKSCIASHNGLDSDTQAIKLHTLKHAGRRVHLFDTPGFDDTHRSNGEILQLLAFWLVKLYEVGIRLKGIVYLHRISDPRIQGSALCGLNVFKAICGKESYGNVVLATTRWNNVHPTEGQRRQRELQETSQFWGELKQGGSLITKVTPGRTSVMQIIDHIVNLNDGATLKLQQQMAIEGKVLKNTDAGAIVSQDLKWEKTSIDARLASLSAELRRAITEHHDRRAISLRQEMSSFNDKIAQHNTAYQALQQGTSALTSHWEQRMKTELDALNQRSIESQKRLDELETLKLENHPMQEWDVLHERHYSKALEERDSSISEKALRVATYSMLFGGASAATGAVSAGTSVLPFLPFMACSIM